MPRQKGVGREVSLKASAVVAEIGQDGGIGSEGGE